MKLPHKIKLLKLKKRLKNRDICVFTGADISTVFNWTSEKYCPKILNRIFADKLIELSSGDITLKDCGY